MKSAPCVSLYERMTEGTLKWAYISASLQLGNTCNPDPKTIRQFMHKNTRITAKKTYNEITPNLPTFPSSLTPTSHTTSPVRIKCNTPAFLHSASHSSALLSDNQSPSGDGTDTLNSGAFLSLNNGDWNVPLPLPGDIIPECAAVVVRGDAARLGGR